MSIKSLHKAKYLMTMQQRVSVHFDGAPTQVIVMHNEYIRIYEHWTRRG